MGDGKGCAGYFKNAMQNVKKTDFHPLELHQAPKINCKEEQVTD
jgi:hypothetical protein